jgi:hypothetical protein
MAHRHAWPFNTPVDPIALGIPDYFQIVTSPMDLGTIMTKLEMNQYGDPEEFHDDVRLVFHNCRLYNAPGSDIVIMANILESEAFEPEWAKLPKWRAEHSSKSQAFDLQQKISELTNTMLAVQEQMRSLTQSALHPVATPVHHAAPRATPPPTAAHRKRQQPTMSFEEKRWLSEQISLLDTEPLIHVVKIINDSHPLVHNPDASAPDVIEIDIESLDITALRKLMNFVKKTTGKSPPSSKKSTKASAKAVAEATAPAASPPRPEAEQPAADPSAVPAPTAALTDDIDIGMSMPAQEHPDDHGSSSSDTDSTTTESDDDQPPVSG